MNNTNLHCLPKHLLGVLVAYSESYTRDDLLRSWNLGMIVFCSVYVTVIIPLFEADITVAHNNYNRYSIMKSDYYYLTFCQQDPLKLYHLNAVYSKVSIGVMGS